MMTKEQLIELAKISKSPSDYEERFVRWAPIAYDKDVLFQFLETASIAKIQGKETQLSKMADIAEHYGGFDFLKLFLEGDPETERLAAIEKWARAAAVDMLIEGKFSVGTMAVISNFPQADYLLVVKRCQELVALISNITAQAESLTSGIPGA